MSRSPHLYHDLLDLAAAIRSRETPAAFISLSADEGEVNCAVTFASDRLPDHPTDPYLTRHSLFGVILERKAADFARELLSRKAGRF